MNITYDRVEGHIVRDQPVWVAFGTQTDDDGTMVPYMHQFPCDTLEWRAAEYGIDPADVDTLLDIVLAEPYLTPQDWATGVHLYEHPDADMDTVKADHIARCAKAATRLKLSTKPDKKDKKPHALDRIRDEHSQWVDSEVVELKSELIARHRREVSNLKASKANEHDAKGRAAAVRRALNAGRDKEHAGTKGQR